MKYVCCPSLNIADGGGVVLDTMAMDAMIHNIQHNAYLGLQIAIACEHYFQVNDLHNICVDRFGRDRYQAGLTHVNDVYDAQLSTPQLWGPILINPRDIAGTLADESNNNNQTLTADQQRFCDTMTSTGNDAPLKPKTELIVCKTEALTPERRGSSPVAESLGGDHGAFDEDREETGGARSSGDVANEEAPTSLTLTKDELTAAGKVTRDSKKLADENLTWQTNRINHFNVSFYLGGIAEVMGDQKTLVDDMITKIENKVVIQSDELNREFGCMCREYLADNTKTLPDFDLVTKPEPLTPPTTKVKIVSPVATKQEAASPAVDTKVDYYDKTADYERQQQQQRLQQQQLPQQETQQASMAESKALSDDLVNTHMERIQAYRRDNPIDCGSADEKPTRNTCSFLVEHVVRVR